MFRRTGRFRRADRLLYSEDYRRIGRDGKRTATRYFVLLVGSPADLRCQNRLRLGITVSRRVGNAVVRNRIKRGVREWFRQNRAIYAEPVDLVVIARREAADLASSEIAKVLNKMAFSDGSSGS